MKLFVAFAALVAVCVATPLKPVHDNHAEMDAIIAAIHSPSTDPATAALLEQQLQQIIGAHQPSPIAVGPAIVEPSSPIHVGPAIIPFPVPEIQPSPIHVGPALIPFPVPEFEPSPIQVGPALIPFPVPEVQPSPVSVPASSPLVQIIVNVNQASAVEALQPEVIAHPVTIVSAEEQIAPTPVNVVDSAVEEISPTPVIVAEVAPSPVIVAEVAPTPVIVAEVAPTPVNVVEEAPQPLEPVIIGNPIVPIPVVNIPQVIN